MLRKLINLFEGVRFEMITPLHVANNIIRRSKSENIDVSPMKLQKLIYFVYREYLQRYNTPLFSERFEVWKYGPVLQSVYGEFRNFKANHINRYYQDKNGKSLVVSESNAYFKEALDAVWSKYKNYDGIYLSSLTHQEDTAWRKAYNEGQSYLDDRDIVSEGKVQ